MWAHGRLLTAALAVALVACGESDDEESVPIEKIAPDKRLVDLSSGEERGVCDWGTAVAKSILPPPGTTFACGGLSIRIAPASCLFTGSELATCTATVRQWQQCFPLLVEQIADDPCLVLQLQAPGALPEFVEDTPGCAGLGACTTTMP